MANHRPIRRSLYFLFFSASIQVLAIASGELIISFSNKLNLDLDPWWLLLWVLLAGFFIARWLKFSAPWVAFNALLVPLSVIWISCNLPSQVLVTALLFALLIYLPTFWTGVPYYPTSSRMYQAVLENLPKDSEFRFIDLGCGFGGLLKYLSINCPKAHFEGVDISPLPLLVCKLRFMFKPSSQIYVRYRNFWHMSLDKYDVVYAFLAPGPMPKLWEKVNREMKPGSKFMTNTFLVDATPQKIIEVEDRRKCTLNIFSV